jgi:hypothetical protein
MNPLLYFDTTNFHTASTDIRTTASVPAENPKVTSNGHLLPFTNDYAAGFQGNLFYCSIHKTALKKSGSFTNKCACIGYATKVSLNTLNMDISSVLSEIDILQLT